MTECEECMAAEKKAHDICSSWFGKQIDTDHHRLDFCWRYHQMRSSQRTYIQHMSDLGDNNVVLVIRVPSPWNLCMSQL